MKPEGSIQTAYNENHDYIVRVKIAKDEDYYNIVKAIRAESPKPLDHLTNDEFTIYAEREKGSAWHLRILAMNPTYTALKIYKKQSLSIYDSEAFEKAVFDKYGDRFKNAFSLQSQRNTMLEIMEDISVSIPEGNIETVEFHNYNGFQKVYITYYEEHDTFSIIADRADKTVQTTGLDFDELEIVLKDMEKDVEKKNMEDIER